MASIRLSRVGDEINITVSGDNFRKSQLIKSTDLLELIEGAPDTGGYIEFRDGCGVRSRAINIGYSNPKKMSRAEECKRRAEKIQKQNKEEEIRTNDARVYHEIDQAVLEGETSLVIGELSKGKVNELKLDGFEVGQRRYGGAYGHLLGVKEFNTHINIYTNGKFCNKTDNV